MNKLLAVCILGGLGLVSRAAVAQEFGQPGQVVIGAERLMGIYSDHLDAKSNVSGEDKLNTTSIAGSAAMPSTTSSRR